MNFQNVYLSDELRFGWRAGTHCLCSTWRRKCKAHGGRGPTKLLKLFLPKLQPTLLRVNQCADDFLITLLMFGFRGLIFLISRCRLRLILIAESLSIVIYQWSRSFPKLFVTWSPWDLRILRYVTFRERICEHPKHDLSPPVWTRMIGNSRMKHATSDRRQYNQSKQNESVCVHCSCRSITYPFYFPLKINEIGYL